MWSLGKWSVTKFIVMPHFRTKSTSKLLAQKQAQIQIPMTSCHTETGYSLIIILGMADSVWCWVFETLDVSWPRIPSRCFTMQLLEEKPVWLQIHPSLVSTHYLYCAVAFHISAVVLISRILSEFQLFDDYLLKIIRFNIVLVSSACTLTGASFYYCFWQIY